MIFRSNLDRKPRVDSKMPGGEDLKRWINGNYNETIDQRRRRTTSPWKRPNAGECRSDFFHHSFADARDHISMTDWKCHSCPKTSRYHHQIKMRQLWLGSLYNYCRSHCTPHEICRICLTISCGPVRFCLPSLTILMKPTEDHHFFRSETPKLPSGNFT